jgi:hypothetical protein
MVSVPYSTLQRYPLHGQLLPVQAAIESLRGCNKLKGHCKKKGDPKIAFLKH